MSDNIKSKIAYELSQRQEREGHLTTPSYNWVRATRVVEHFNEVPRPDDEDWIRESEEYAEWASYFEGK